MKPRTILILSLCLNLTLVAALLYQTSTQGRDQYRGGVTITNLITETSVEVVRTPAAKEPPPFKWGDIESADYKIYIANLKGIGCPAATIRDIILAEVADQYTAKRPALIAGIQARFWEMEAARPGSVETAISGAIKELDAEREALADQLLALIGPIEEPRPERSRLWSFLPEEKRAKVLALERRYAQAHNEQVPHNAEALPGKLKAVEQQRLADLKQLLSPSEWEEFQARNSKNSDWASKLYGFEPTAEEYRVVTRFQDELTKKFAPADPNEPGDLVGLLAARDEGMKKLLGEKRFEEFQRANDPNFEAMYKVAGRYQLPPETAVQAYQVRQAAEEQLAVLARQDTLTDEQRLAALQTVRVETEKALRKAFGDDAFQTYLKYGGGWLTKLDQP